MGGGAGTRDERGGSAGVALGRRRLVIGWGMPSDPRIAVSSSNGVTPKLFIQTSRGVVARLDGPLKGGDPLERVYWKQDQ